jgi:hypothetical protein
VPAASDQGVVERGHIDLRRVRRTGGAGRAGGGAGGPGHLEEVTAALEVVKAGQAVRADALLLGGFQHPALRVQAGKAPMAALAGKAAQHAVVAAGGVGQQIGQRGRVEGGVAVVDQQRPFVDVGLGGQHRLGLAAGQAIDQFQGADAPCQFRRQQGQRVGLGCGAALGHQHQAVHPLQRQAAQGVHQQRLASGADGVLGQGEAGLREARAGTGHGQDAGDHGAVSAAKACHRAWSSSVCGPRGRSAASQPRRVAGSGWVGSTSRPKLSPGMRCTLRPLNRQVKARLV